MRCVLYLRSLRRTARRNARGKDTAQYPVCVGSLALVVLMLVHYCQMSAISKSWTLFLKFAGAMTFFQHVCVVIDPVMSLAKYILVLSLNHIQGAQRVCRSEFEANLDD